MEFLIFLRKRWHLLNMFLRYFINIFILKMQSNVINFLLIFKIQLYKLGNLDSSSFLVCNSTWHGKYHLWRRLLPLIFLARCFPQNQLQLILKVFETFFLIVDLHYFLSFRIKFDWLLLIAIILSMFQLDFYIIVNQADVQRVYQSCVNILFTFVFSQFTEYSVKIIAIFLLKNWIVVGRFWGFVSLNCLSFSWGGDGHKVERRHGIVINFICVLIIMTWFDVWKLISYFVIFISSKFGGSRWSVFF